MMISLPIWKNGGQENRHSLSVQGGPIIYEPSGVYEKLLSRLYCLRSCKMQSGKSNGQKSEMKLALWSYSECRYMKVTKVPAQKRSKDTNTTSNEHICGPIQNADIRRWQKLQHKKWSKDTNTTRSGIAMNTFVAHSEMKIYEGDKSLWPKQVKRY